MFKTIFTVTKLVGDSKEYSAYFENYFDAFVFAKKEVAKIKIGCEMRKRGYLDGGFQLSWDLGNTEFIMNDFAWITDFRFNGVGFYNESGLLIDDFCSMESLREYFKRSRRIAKGEYS